MDPKVPRRTLLKTLTGAAAVGSAACSRPTNNASKAVSTSIPVATATLAPPPRVNLICHGMLLFWQNKSSPKSGITIYAPNTMGTHEIRLATVVGGLPNLLGSQAGSYQLQFGNSATSIHGPMDKTKNAVFYDDSATPKGLAINPSNAPFQLSVPYPTSVRRHRIMTFSSANPPYDPSGATVTDFGVTPLEMAGTYVLSWGNVDTDVRLKKAMSPDVVIAPMNAPLVNLLLYHCPLLAGSSSHLPHFNGLLRYNGHPQLDLTVKNGMPGTTPKEQEMVEIDLSVMDTWDLQDLQNQFGEDPVGCLQGWAS